MACGAPVALPAGPVDVTTESGGARPLWLRLRSEAPDGLPATRGGGAVLRPGDARHSTVEGAQVRLDGPAWIVLGQSYERGWRARCDGRDLGPPVPLQGYANGWRVDGGCRAVDFAYGPDRAVKLAMLVSGLAALGLLGLLLLRRRPRPAAADPPPGPDPRSPTGPRGRPGGTRWRWARSRACWARR